MSNVFNACRRSSLEQFNNHIDMIPVIQPLFLFLDGKCIALDDVSKIFVDDFKDNEMRNIITQAGRISYVDSLPLTFFQRFSIFIVRTSDPIQRIFHAASL